MTLPAAFPMSMSQIATELGLSLPLSINHAWVIALAHKNALPVSFSDLLGKTGRFDGSATGQIAGGQFTTVFIGVSAPLFDGQISQLSVAEEPGNAYSLQLTFASPPTPGARAPYWPYNIRVTNNTTGASFVLPNIGQYAWSVTASGSNPYFNVIRSGFTDSFTFLPSN